MLGFSHPAPALIEADEFADIFHDPSLAFCREFFAGQEVLPAIGPAISHKRQHPFLYVVEEDIIFSLDPAGLVIVQHAVVQPKTAVLKRCYPLISVDYVLKQRSV